MADVEQKRTLGHRSRGHSIKKRHANLMKLHENNARQKLLHKKPKPLRSSDAKWSLRFIYSCKTSETLLERYCLLHLTLNPIRTQPCTVPVIISRRQLSA